MRSTITIILPIHNGERTMRGQVYQILELSEIVGRRLRVVIVDDGSTDDTYEAACELARMYPQICVLRQPFVRGLGAALEQVRRTLSAEHVIVHDGVSPLDIHALADLIRETPGGALTVPAAHVDARGSRRVAAATALSSHSLDGNRASASLQWLRLDEPMTPRRRRLEPAGAVFERSALLGGYAPAE